eukprot:SM000130S27106  [mRNA]  locus=s130:245160:246208:+ [translate_table: standard]
MLVGAAGADSAGAAPVAGSGALKKVAPAVGSATLADHVVLEGEAAAVPAAEQEKVADRPLPGPPPGRPPGTAKATAKEERRQRREVRRVEKRARKEQRRAEKRARRGDGEGRRGGGAAASPSGSSDDDMSDQLQRMPSRRSAADSGNGDARTQVASRDSVREQRHEAAAVPSITKRGRHDSSSDEDVRDKGDDVRRPSAGGAGSTAAKRAGAPLRRPRHNTESDDDDSNDDGRAQKGRYSLATGRGEDTRSDRSHGRRSPERDRMYDRRRADRSRERR